MTDVQGSRLQSISSTYYGSLRDTTGIQEQLSEIVVGLAPFVPFSQAFTLKQEQTSGGTMITPQSEGQDLVSNIINYEFATGDPAPEADPIRTMKVGERVRSIKNANDEIGELMRDATIFGFEKNPKKSTYGLPQEIVTDEIALDLFDKLSKDDQEDIFDLQLDSEKEIERMHSTSFDINMYNLEGRKKMHSSLLALSKLSNAPKSLLKRIAGIEITAAGSPDIKAGKYVQKIFGATYGGEDIEATWAESAQQWVTDINTRFEDIIEQGNVKSIGDVLRKTKGAGTKGPLSEIVDYELNQALRRFQDMLKMSTQEALGKDTYLYSVPLRTDNKMAQGNAYIAWEGKNLSARLVLQHAEVIKGDKTSDLAIGFEQVLLEGLKQYITAGGTTLKEYHSRFLKQLSSMAVAQSYTRNTIGLIADPTIDAINATNAYGTMVNMMSSKQISQGLGDVLSGVTRTVEPKIKEVFNKIMTYSRNTTHNWKKQAAQRVWDGQINKFDFGVNKSAGVWAPREASWVNEVGYGFAVSPMLGIFDDARTATRWKTAVRTAR